MQTETIKGCLRGVMVNALDRGIRVNEFELQSRYYVHLRKKYPWGKVWTPLNLPAMGKILPLLFFERDDFIIK